MARERKEDPDMQSRRWLRVAVAVAICASTAVAALAIRRYTIADSHFTLSRETKGSIVFQGLVNTPLWKAQRIFEGDYGRSVYSIPLSERRRSLLAIDWVEDASVTRVVPDRLLVRIRERTPVAFAVMRGGAMLVDAQGVLMEPPPQGKLAFPALSGLQPEESESARRERVQAFLAFEHDMGYLANDVSEVDVTDPANLRVVSQQGGRAVELQMGDGQYARRYQTFVSSYPDIHSRSPELTAFDLRLDGRITAR